MCCGLGQDGKDKIVSSDEPGATKVGSLQSTQCASAGGAMGRQLDLHPFFIGLIVSADRHHVSEAQGSHETPRG